MKTLTFKVPDEIAQELENICKEEKCDKSWFIKKALIEKIEEWCDIKIALKGRAEYEKNPNSFLTHEQVLEKLGLKESDLKA